MILYYTFNTRKWELIKKRHFIIFILLFFSFGKGTIFAQDNFISTQKNIEAILDENGEIKTGETGSFNAEGFDMIYSENGKPIFKKTETLLKDKGIFNFSNLGNKINGISGTVFAVAVGAEGIIYVGGSFRTAGGVIANRIAKWDGNDWSTLGSGFNSQVKAIAISGNDVYVGGSFFYLGDNVTGAYYIAKWDGSNWEALGDGDNNGLDGSVNTIAVSGSGEIFVGGSFTKAGGNPASNIAKWNPATSSWSALGVGLNNTVFALAINGSGDVYAGGSFTTAGGNSASYIAKWNTTTSSWSALGAGLNNIVYALAASGSDIFVGGNFSQLGDNTGAYYRIAKWNGNSWSALGGGMTNAGNNQVYSIAINGSDVYIGGNFNTTNNGTVPASYIAKWNTTTSIWSTLISDSYNGVNSIVRAMAIVNNDVCIGGEFTTAGGNTANRIAKWTHGSTAWSSFTSSGIINGLNNTVNAVAVNGSDVYVGGDFTQLSDGVTTVNYIAKWNGLEWSALGDGLNGAVNSIAINGGNVYVGGEFFLFGDNITSAKFVAKWNGASWETLGSGAGNGLNGYVNALAISGAGDVYAGGNFTTAGGNPASCIAKWDGSNWASLGGGLNGTAHTIAISGIGEVYVGGEFTTAEGNSVNHVAKWNGGNWSALGSGFNNNVYSISINGGGDVYTGGNFTQLGDNSGIFNRIAKWNGSNWTALEGAGINGLAGTVYTISLSNNNVYVGGSFSLLGDFSTSASHLAKWNGTTWAGVGNGIDGNVYDMEVNTTDQKMYFGGLFTIINSSVVAQKIGIFTDSDNSFPVELTGFNASLKNNDIILTWQTATEINNFGFEIERASVINGLYNNWQTINFINGAGNSNTPKFYVHTDSNLPPGKYAYRLKQFDNDGGFKFSEIVEVTINTFPNYFELTQNFPNPFNPTTKIKYSIPVDGNVTLKVYNSIGQLVKTLINSNHKAGSYTKIFNGKDLCSGVYFYKLEAGNFKDVKKMFLCK